MLLVVSIPPEIASPTDFFSCYTCIFCGPARLSMSLPIILGVNHALVDLLALLYATVSGYSPESGTLLKKPQTWEHLPLGPKVKVERKEGTQVHQSSKLKTLWKVNYSSHRSSPD